MARDDPHFRLRIPEAIKARIESAAADNARSINAEIVQRLTESLDSDEEKERLWTELHKREARIRQVEELAYEKEKHLNTALEQYKTLAARQDVLLKAVCYRLLQFKSAVPEDAFQLAENLLNADGSEDGAFSIENDKYAPQVALARYHAAVVKLRYSPADASQTTDNRRTSRRRESNAAKLKKGSAA